MQKNNNRNIQSQGRQIAYNVYLFMKREKDEGRLTIPLNCVMDRVSEATGISGSTIKRIVREGQRKNDNEQFPNRRLNIKKWTKKNKKGAEAETKTTNTDSRKSTGNTAAKIIVPDMSGTAAAPQVQRIIVPNLLNLNQPNGTNRILLWNQANPTMPPNVLTLRLEPSIIKKPVESTITPSPAVTEIHQHKPKFEEVKIEIKEEPSIEIKEEPLDLDYNNS